MKLVLGQINTCVGNLSYNTSVMSEVLIQCQKSKPDLVVFPELSLFGYPPRDHLFEQGHIDHGWHLLKELARCHADQTFLVGMVDRDERGRLYNAAVLAQQGQITWKQHKCLLPQYDVFDELRYFHPGQAFSLLRLADYSLGVVICEDAWSSVQVEQRYYYDDSPMRRYKDMGVDMIVNLSASPFAVGKTEFRLALFKSWISELNCPMVFCNLVGGNDDLIFDGCSFVMDDNGVLLKQAKAFAQDIIEVELSKSSSAVVSGKPIPVWPLLREEQMYQALTLGLKDFITKCGGQQVVVGLSGGIDSALVVCIAVNALGANNVHCIYMPSVFSSQVSLDGARQLCAKLSVKLTTISIEPAVETFQQSLRPAFQGSPNGDSTDENIQARIRGVLLMAHANKYGGLVLNTGNKSELATGYCTLYGDMVGAVSVLADVYKTEVYALARWINRDQEIIPWPTIDRPPSAELRENQTDQDSLPPYDQLDAVLRLYIEGCESVARIVARGYDQSMVERVVTLCQRSEFKRRQSPPGLRVSDKAFGPGRKMMIARGPL